MKMNRCPMLSTFPMKKVKVTPTVTLTMKKICAKTMIIDQSDYVTEIASRFNVSNAAPVADPSVHLSQDMGPANSREQRDMQRRPYQSATQDH